MRTTVSSLMLVATLTVVVSPRISGQVKAAPDAKPVAESPTLPYPTFIPADAIAVVQLCGWRPLVNRIAKAATPIAPDDQVRAVLLERIETALFSRDGLPGIHPNRPIYLGVFDPGRIEAPLPSLRSIETFADVGDFAVLGVPLTEEGLFLGVLGETLDFQEETTDAGTRYRHEKRRFDYTRWSESQAHNGKTQGSSDLARFTTKQVRDVFYRRSGDYGLLTTNRVIAARLAETTGETNDRKSPNEDRSPPRDARLMHAGDDIVAWVNVKQLRDTYEEQIRAGMEQIKAVVAGSASQGKKAGAEGHTPELFSGVIDLYFELVDTMLKSIESIEFSARVVDDGFVSRFSVRPVPGTELERVLHAGRTATPALLGLLPDDMAFTYSGDVAADEVFAELTTKFIDRLATGTDPAVNRDRIHTHVRQSRAFLEYCAGPVAAGFDFGTETGIALVQIVELKKGAETAKSVKRMLRSDTPWNPLLELDMLGIQARGLSPETIEGVEFQRAELAADEMLELIVGKLQTNIGVVDEHLVVVAGSKIEALTAQVIRKFRGTSDRRVAFEIDAIDAQSTSPSFFGEVDALRFMMTGFAMVSSETTGGENFLDAAIHERQTKTRREPLRFWFSDHDVFQSFSLHCSSDALRGFHEFGELHKQIRRLEVTWARMNSLRQFLGQFKRRHGRFPTVDEGLGALTQSIDGKPGLVDRERHGNLLNDGWMRRFRYENDKTGVRVVSLGGDGKVGGKGTGQDVIARVY